MDKEEIEKRKKTQVIVIGLGSMGYGVAINIAKAGFSTKVHDISSEAVQRVIDNSPAKAVQNLDTDIASCDIMVSVVCFPAETMRIVKENVVPNMKKGSIFVDFSTNELKVTEEIGDLCDKAGIAFIDCPMTGSAKKANHGTLVLMAGCDSDEMMAKAEPVLDACASRLYKVGKKGHGMKMKLCNQVLVSGVHTSIAEAFSLASSVGIDLETLNEMAIHGSAGSFSLKVFAPAWRQHKHPGFRPEIFLKDLKECENIAEHEKLNMPGLRYARMAYQRVVDKDPNFEKMLSVVDVLTEDNRGSGGDHVCPCEEHEAPQQNPKATL